MPTAWAMLCPAPGPPSGPVGSWPPLGRIAPRAPIGALCSRAGQGCRSKIALVYPRGGGVSAQPPNQPLLVDRGYAEIANHGFLLPQTGSVLGSDAAIGSVPAHSGLGRYIEREAPIMQRIGSAPRVTAQFSLAFISI